MQVGKNDKLAGVRLIKVRDFLRQHDESFSGEALAEFFKVNGDRKQEIEQGLLGAGYSEHHQSEKSRYLVTSLGRQLCNAKFVSRISREQAEILVRSFLDRVASINERDELTHRVTGVRVFGSYVGERADLGDVDLAVAIEPRRETHVEESIERAQQSGKSIRNFLDRITFGPTEVKKILKDGSPYLSIHDFEEVEKLGTPYEVIFSRDNDLPHV